MRVLQLGNNSYVAGVQPRNLIPVLALCHREVVQLLGCFTRCVPHFSTACHRARPHAEKSHIANVRFGNRLEHLTYERAVVVGLQLHLFRGTPNRATAWGNFSRRRDELCQLREHGTHTVREGRRAAQQREYPSFDHPFLGSS